MPSFPNHALADTAPGIELLVRQIAQSRVVGFVIGLGFRLVRTGFRACIRCVAADIGGVGHLALLRGFALTVVAAQTIAAKATLPTNNLIVLPPYLSGAIIKSKLRAHPISVSGAQW